MSQRGTQIALRGAMERQRGTEAGPTLPFMRSRIQGAFTSPESAIW